MRRLSFPEHKSLNPTADRSAPPTLEVVLRGGLGNQLYQWAFTELVREALPIRVVFDSSIVNLGGIHWGEQLSQLIPAVNVSDRRRRPITALMSKPVWAIARYYQWFYPKFESFRHSTPQQAIRRLSHGLNARVADPCMFIADYDAHREIALSVGRYLAESHPISAPHAALHIRRGDYHQQWARALLSPDFYVRGAEKMNAGVPLWIVSDDKEFAGQVADQMVAAGIEAVVVGGEDHYYDLAVLASASSLLLSTSTFSWWGAYIAETVKGASVYFPDPWSPDQMTEKLRFALPKWHGVPRR